MYIAKKRGTRLLMLKNNQRGEHNSYGHACITKQDCENTLKALEDKDIEMSRRNVIDLDIEKIIKNRN